MRWLRSLRSKIFFRFNDATSKNLRPKPIRDHARREKIPVGRDPFGERGAIAIRRQIGEREGRARL